MIINRQYLRSINCYAGQCKPKYIVMHQMENHNAGALQHAKAHFNGNLRTSFHYGVDATGGYQLLKHTDGAWAVGDDLDDSDDGINNFNSINIEMSDEGGYVSEATLTKAIELAKFIMAETGIPLSNVVRHYEASGKWCPKDIMNNGNWAAVKSRINGSAVSTGPSVVVPEPGKVNYVNLKPILSSWAVYPTNIAPVKANAKGYLNPKGQGGLSYKVLGNPQNDVYTIQTQSFGKVNIYCPNDNEGFVGAAAYQVVGGSQVTPVAPPVPSTRYVNLTTVRDTWAVYPITGPAKTGYQSGYLAPKAMGGMSYPILSAYGDDVYGIRTNSFGEVKIYCPNDNEGYVGAAAYQIV